MTKPEQLAKWREEARVEYLNDDNIRVEDIAEEHYVAGYLRTKQETEQAIKDAEKLRTVVISLIAACEEREGDDGERCYLVPAQEFDDLQELLND